MSLADVLQDIAATLKVQLEELKTSELAGGRFDIEELRRRSQALPAAFVACTGTRDGRLAYGKLECRGLFVVVLAAVSGVEGKPTPQNRAAAITRLLTRAMYKIAGAEDWGNSEVAGNPEKVASANPYSVAADKNGVALWGITWEQDLELTADTEPAELPDLIEIHADWQMVESTNEKDAEDDVDTENP